MVTQRVYVSLSLRHAEARAQHLRQEIQCKSWPCVCNPHRDLHSCNILRRVAVIQARSAGHPADLLLSSSLQHRLGLLCSACHPARPPSTPLQAPLRTWTLIKMTGMEQNTLQSRCVHHFKTNAAGIRVIASGLVQPATIVTTKKNKMYWQNVPPWSDNPTNIQAASSSA